MCSTDIQLAWAMHYQDLWELDSDKDNPFTGVSYSERESLYGDYDVRKNRLRIYMEEDVKKYTGLNFLQFLELDRAFQKELVSVCSDRKAKEAKTTNKLLEELDPNKDD